jgi:hypothetical protein
VHRVLIDVTKAWQTATALATSVVDVEVEAGGGEEVFSPRPGMDEAGRHLRVAFAEGVVDEQGGGESNLPCQLDHHMHN